MSSPASPPVSSLSPSESPPALPPRPKSPRCDAGAGARRPKPPPVPATKPLALLHGRAAAAVADDIPPPLLPPRDDVPPPPPPKPRPAPRTVWRHDGGSPAEQQAAPDAVASPHDIPRGSPAAVVTVAVVAPAPRIPANVDIPPPADPIPADVDIPPPADPIENVPHVVADVAVDAEAEAETKTEAETEAETSAIAKPPSLVRLSESEEVQSLLSMLDDLENSQTPIPKPQRPAPVVPAAVVVAAPPRVVATAQELHASQLEPQQPAAVGGQGREENRAPVHIRDRRMTAPAVRLTEVVCRSDLYR
eukprot:m51a1_g6017 hypothetical protein (306) ;mRNA; f:76349-77578